jgi:phosphatidate cytidylyltransferase
MSEIPHNSMLAMLYVLMLLITASAVSIFLKLKNPNRDYTNLRQRIKSWWWMIALIFAALAISKKSAIIFFGFLSFLALKEFCSIAALRQADRRVLFWAYGNTSSILLRLYWLVWNVHNFHSSLYVFIFTNQNGFDWSESRLHKISGYYSMGFNVNGFLY